MGEANANAEIARHLDEHSRHGSTLRNELLEILEAVLLAVVAVITAWSGYQAAIWNGESARAYAESARERIEAERLYVRGGQVLAYDAGTFNAWLEATLRGQDDVAAAMLKRFTPEYRVAFDAWLELDPLDNPDAPAGPGLMPEYHNALQEESAELAEQSSASFEEAVHARETGDDYVRITVVLAGVLFLIAVGQRFQVRGVRIAVVVLAGAFLAFGIALLATLPRT
jgi:hypothetical protein